MSYTIISNHFDASLLCFFYSSTTTSSGSNMKNIITFNVKTAVPANALFTDTNTTSLPIKDQYLTTQFTATDTTGLVFTAGGDATVAFNSTGKIVTFSATDTTYSLATTSADGLMLKYPAQHGNKFMRADNSWQMVPLEKTL